MKKKTIEKTYKGITYRQVFTRSSTCTGCAFVNNPANQCRRPKCFTDTCTRLSPCPSCAFANNPANRCRRPKCFTETCAPYGEPSYIWKRVTPKLVDYTVILLYPDFMTDSYPQFFSAVVAARNPIHAVAVARRRVASLNKEGLDEDADLADIFMVVSVHRGAHKELNPEA